MKFKNFCKLYNNAIILLEGKRVVKLEDQEKLIAIGKLLATHLPNVTFRSGNADGSDYYFSQGVSQVNPNKLEVITPYQNHRKKYNVAGTTHALNTINHKGTRPIAIGNTRSAQFPLCTQPPLPRERGQGVRPAPISPSNFHQSCTPPPG